MSCAKFECAGWVRSSSGKRGQHQGFPGEVHASYAGEPECSCRCGLPWSAHSDAELGVEHPAAAQEAALPHLERYSFVSHDFGGRIERDDHGIWARYAAANYWRTEALQQRERADGLEGERAELLKRVAERDGWVCELRERAEEAEAELAALKAEHAAALELMRRCANALRRHLDGHAPMRIPADFSGDSDLVLADVEQWLRDKEGA